MGARPNGPFQMFAPAQFSRYANWRLLRRCSGGPVGILVTLKLGAYRPWGHYLEAIKVLRHAAAQRVVRVHVGAVDLEREREVAARARVADGRVRAHDGHLCAREARACMLRQCIEDGFKGCARVRERAQ